MLFDILVWYAIGWAILGTVGVIFNPMLRRRALRKEAAEAQALVKALFSASGSSVADPQSAKPRTIFDFSGSSPDLDGHD